MPFRAGWSTGLTSGNNVSNPSFTVPSSGTGGTVVAGDVAWLFIDAADTGTVTTPTGWTLVTQTSAAGTVSIRRYWKVLVSGDIGATTVLATSGAQRRSIEVVVFSGVNTTTPEATETPAGIAYTTTSNTRANPSATLLGTRDVIAKVANRQPTTTSWTMPAGWTLGIDAYNSGTGGATGATAYKEAVAAGSVGGDNWTSNNSVAGAVTQLVVINPASTAYTDGPTVTVTATGSAAGIKGLVSAASQAIAATLSAVGSRGQTSAAPQTVTASIAAAGARGVASSGTVTTTATISADGAVSKTAGSTQTVTATITADGTRAATGAGDVTVTATLSAFGSRGQASPAPQAVTATLDATGSRGQTGAGSQAVFATITAAGTVAKTATADVAVTATLSADGAVTSASGGDANAVITATITAAGTRAASGTGDQTTTAGITAAGVRGQAADAPQTLSVSISADGTVTKTAASSQAVTVTITAAGDVTGSLSAAADLALVATLTAAGNVTTHGNDRDITLTGTLERTWRATLLQARHADLEPGSRRAQLDQDRQADLTRSWKAHT